MGERFYGSKGRLWKETDWTIRSEGSRRVCSQTCCTKGHTFAGLRLYARQRAAAEFDTLERIVIIHVSKFAEYALLLFNVIHFSCADTDSQAKRMSVNCVWCRTEFLAKRAWSDAIRVAPYFRDLDALDIELYQATTECLKHERYPLFRSVYVSECGGQRVYFVVHTNPRIVLNVDAFTGQYSLTMDSTDGKFAQGERCFDSLKQIMHKYPMFKLVNDTK